MTRYLWASLTLSVVLAACSSQPPGFGDKLAVRSAQADAMAKQWNKGQADVAKGEKLIKKGQSLVEEGQKLIENGKKQMANSEASYQNMRSSPIQSK